LSSTPLMIEIILHRIPTHALGEQQRLEAGGWVRYYVPSSTLGGDLNRSAQHFTFETEVECDATTTEAAFLYGGGEC